MRATSPKGEVCLWRLYAARGGIKQAMRGPTAARGLAVHYYEPASGHPLRENCRVKTSVVFFPFDLFGSGGTAAGVQLLADELREMIADNRRETVATRARCYTDQLK